MPLRPPARGGPPRGSVAWKGRTPAGVRARRGLVQLILLLLLSRVAADKKVSVKESLLDSAVSDIRWFGADQRTVIVKTNKGRLYRSTNAGDKWSDITDLLKNEAGSSSSSLVTVDRLVKSKASVDVVLAVGTEKTNYISVDAGETWRRLRHKSTIHSFLFHKSRPKWALLSTWSKGCEKKKEKSRSDDEEKDDDVGPCNHMLFLTKDLGRTFSLVTSYVVQFAWGNSDHNQEDRIYFTHFEQKSGDQPKQYYWMKNVDLVCTDNGGRSIQTLVRGGNKFLVSYNFVFVAKLQDSAAQTVTLMVSSDGGRTFRPAKLPQDLGEKSYTILDASEGAVMLHVNHGTHEPPYNVGNVYISDGQGVRYTLSLPNNVRGEHGDCEFDKILSMEGVYMANFRDVPRTEAATAEKEEGTGGKTTANAEEEEDEEVPDDTEVDKRHSNAAKSKDESVVRSVISFDKGGVWSYLKPPKVDSIGKPIDCPPDKCWLHLHGITNFQNYPPFYSTENAVGIIMGVGNVGPHLRFEPDQTNTYLSRDGGLTFLEAHKGAFIYEYGDHGGLVVMADDIRKTKQVVFSWNEGQSWYDFEVSDSPFEVDNIVTEPNATSTKFLMYGSRGEAGVIYYLDFSALGQPLCKGVWAADSVSSDYETWIPSDGRSSEKCMLGRQVSYTRRKQTAECFNGEKFERPTTRKNCACTEENFECEMGFARKVGSMECKFADDGAIEQPAMCTSSDYFWVEAHRKVIGDTCEGGWQPSKVRVPCPANSRLSRGALSVLGTIAMVGTIMGAVTVLSRSDRFKGMFANLGFESNPLVAYTTIGGKLPETALDACEFIEDQDAFDNDAPQLMAYNTDRGADRGAGDRQDREHDRREAIPRRIDTAASQVPRLQKPPAGGGGGGAGEEDDGLDLL